MYRWSSLIAVIATIGWLGFIFAAFRGFSFWYGGFVVFFWIALGFLNYRHESSLWLLKNRFLIFLKFYVVMIVLSFIGDLLIGQNIAHLWTYPHYAHLSDWIRLYLVLYPFGALAVLELMYLLGWVTGEKLVFHKLDHTPPIFHLLIHRFDALLLFLILFLLVMRFFVIIGNLREIMVGLLLVWMCVGTIRLHHHLKHLRHLLGIFLATLLVSVFLHEFPNVGTYEWVYFKSPILNHQIFGIYLWVIVGWYLLVLGTLRMWMLLGADRNQYN